MAIRLNKSQKIGGVDYPNGIAIIGLDKAVESLASQGGAASPVNLAVAENPVQVLPGSGPIPDRLSSLSRAIAFGQRQLLRRLNVLGDSLTTYSTMPHVPRGATTWNTSGITTGAGGLNSVAGGSWINNYAIDGRAPAGAGGVLETDGAGRLRWTYTADAAGPWVDVSAGGFFEIPSATDARGIFVAICKNRQRATATSETLAVAGFPNSNIGSPILFPSWLQAALGPGVAMSHYGISGDTLDNIISRGAQAWANSPDALVTLIGVNDSPATAAEADALAAKYISWSETAIQFVPMLYVGGVFPQASSSVAARQHLSRFSESMRRYALTRPLQVRYWDEYNRMAHPTATDGTCRTGVQHTDLLHLMPFGAALAGNGNLLQQLMQDWSLPTAAQRSRAISPWDSTTRSGYVNTNPLLKGSAGTGSGSNGVTGPVPDGWAVTRSGANQTCVLSTQSLPDAPDAFVVTVANASAASEYHQFSQSVAAPTGIAVGDFIALEFDGQLLQATLIGTLQAQLVTNGNTKGTYLLQPTRAVSTFASGVLQPPINLRSEPIKYEAGMFPMTLTMRFGGGFGSAAGSSGSLLVKRLEVLIVD